MSVALGCTPQDHAAGLLKPWRVLRQLRPVSLKCIADILSDRLYQCQALRLTQTHFPALAAATQPAEDWDDMLRSFLQFVEAEDWFEVDWDILNSLWEAWMGSDDDVYRHDMAAYLTGIPVRCYGFTEDDLECFLGLRVLAALLSDRYEISADALIRLEIYDGMDDLFCYTVETMQRRLDSIDFSRYEAPLCWLGEIGHIAIGDTGNVLLDTAFEYEDWWPDFFTWAKDVDRLKQAWLEAKERVDHLRIFRHWLAEDDDAEAALAKVRTILEILGGYDDL